MKTKKRNMQDATLRNTRALKKAVEKIKGIHIDDLTALEKSLMNYVDNKFNELHSMYNYLDTCIGEVYNDCERSFVKKKLKTHGKKKKCQK